MRLMMGRPGLGHFPGSSPPSLSSSLPSACPGSPSAGGHPTPPRDPHTTVTARQSPHPPHFSLLHSPHPAFLSRGGTGGLAWQRERFPGRRGAGRPRGAPAVRHPLPGRHPAGPVCASREGSGLPSAPGAGGSSGWCRCTALPALPATRAPLSPLSRAISGTAALPLGGRIPGHRRAALPSGARSPRWRERGAPLRRPGLRGEGAERRRGEEGASPAAARPSAGTARRRSGGGRAAGAALPRGRCISGQGPVGVLGRFLGRCRPRLRGSCRSPRGWLYKYVCRCLSRGSVAGFCGRGSGESVWKARPSGAFPQDWFWGSGVLAIRVAVPEPRSHRSP